MPGILFNNDKTVAIQSDGGNVFPMQDLAKGFTGVDPNTGAPVPINPGKLNLDPTQSARTLMAGPSGSSKAVRRALSMRPPIGAPRTCSPWTRAWPDRPAPPLACPAPLTNSVRGTW